MYKRICLVCGNENQNSIVTGIESEYCLECGESLIEFVDVEVDTLQELLKYRLQRESQNIL